MNLVAKFCKIFALLLGALCFFGSWIIAESEGKDFVYNSTFTYGREIRDWPLTLGIFAGIMLSSLIICIIIYALGEIIQLLHNQSQYQMSQANRLLYTNKCTTDNSKVLDSDWFCSQCGSKNISFNLYCKNCGKEHSKHII